MKIFNGRLDSIMQFKKNVENETFEQTKIEMENENFNFQHRLLKKRKLIKKKTGDEILKDIREDFMSFMDIWSENQLYFFEMMLLTAAKWIYGDEIKKNLLKILNKNGWRKLTDFVLFLAPRREGKSFVVSGAAAAFILNIPNVLVSVYSVGQRTSSKMGESIKDFLSKSKKKINFKKNNDETLRIDGFEDKHDKRTLKCFPASIDKA